MATSIGILIFLILVALALKHLQRAFFYPPPRDMPEDVDEDIAAALRRFEAALAEHAPDVLASLRPGLSDEEIRKIESRYRLRLTEEMRALYRWRNGSPPNNRVDLIPGHRFVPLNRAARTRVLLRRQASTAPIVQRVAYFVFAGHRTNWLTVLDDLCGDGYFYDPARRRSHGGFFKHFAEVREYRFFPSLAAFLTGAAECYETGIYYGCRRGRAEEDYDRSFALWSRYASSPEA